MDEHIRYSEGCKMNTDDFAYRCYKSKLSPIEVEICITY